MIHSLIFHFLITKRQITRHDAVSFFNAVRTMVQRGVGVAIPKQYGFSNLLLLNDRNEMGTLTIYTFILHD